MVAEDLGVLNLTSIDGAAAAPSGPIPAIPDEVTR